MTDFCYPSLLPRNPLYNDVILATVFNNLDFKDLQNCRRVCSKWNHRASDVLKKSSQLILNNRNYRKRMKKLATFSYPIASKQIVIKDFIMENKFTDKNFHLFISNHVNQITRLFVTLSTFQDQCSIRNIQNQLTRLSSLEHLSIHVRPNQCPKCSWKRISGENADISHRSIARLPNLKSLEFIIFKCKVIEADKEFLLLLSDLCNDAPNICSIHTNSNLPFIAFDKHGCENIKKIKNIHVIHNVNGESLTFLLKWSQIGMKLESFSFEDASSKNNEVVLNSLLRKQSNSLKNLSLHTDCRAGLQSEHSALELPEMRNLLVFTESSEENLIYFNQPLCFSSHFPALRKLDLRCNSENSEIKSTIGALFSPTGKHGPILSLNELHLPANWTVSDSEGIKTLGYLFPSVTDTSIDITGASCIAAFWKCWPDMKSLRLSIQINERETDILEIDSVFTGIRIDDCKNLLCEDEEENVFIIFPKNYPFQPSIRDMKKLRQLVISCFGTERSLITDITGYYGLAQLTELRSLTVQLSSSSQISRECYRDLKRKLRKCRKLMV